MVDKMKRILIIHTGVFEINGISEMISNLVQRMVEEKEFEITIGFNGKNINEKYYTIFKSMDVSLVSLGNKRKNLILYLKNLYMLSKKMDIIHINGNSGMMGLEILFLANHRRVLLSHVHNTSSELPFLEKILKRIVNKNTDVRLAASKSAGVFLYGNNDFVIVPNGIDTKKFTYKEENVDYLKSMYNLPLNHKIFLNIGRLEYQKNQVRLVNIFSKMIKKSKDIHLLIVGDGKDLSILENQINKYSLEKNITILREENEIEKIYNIANFFILPSRFEAFPVTLIEAQTSGLICIVSQEAVGEEVNISNNVKFVSLSENDEVWADIALNLKENLDRQGSSKLMYDKGYDRENSFDKIIDIYIKAGEIL